MFPRKETKESVAYCRFGSWTVPVRGLFFFFVLNGNRTFRLGGPEVSTKKGVTVRVSVTGSCLSLAFGSEYTWSLDPKN